MVSFVGNCGDCSASASVLASDFASDAEALAATPTVSALLESSVSVAATDMTDEEVSWWRHSNGAANLESAIVQELLRNRHFAGLVRQFALPYVRLIKPFGTDFLHGHGFLVPSTNVVTV